MPYEETSGSVDHHSPAEIPFLCLRLAQGAAALVLLCDVLAWISAAAIWPLLASLGLCLIIVIAGLATFSLIQRARRGDGIAFHRRLLGFYAATGMSLILLVLRGSSASLAGPVIGFVLSLFAFVLLLWAGVESGGVIENGSAARDQQNVEPPKSVY